VYSVKNPKKLKLTMFAFIQNSLEEYAFWVLICVVFGLIVAFVDCDDKSTTNTTNAKETSNIKKTRETKEEFVGRTVAKLTKLYNEKNEYQELSKKRDLTDEEVQYVFNIFYNAKDLIECYAKKMELTEEDELMKKESEWVRTEMENFLEGTVGPLFDVRKECDYISDKGEKVKGTSVSVKKIPFVRQHQSVVLYNWLQVDEWFWLIDHRAELEDFEKKMDKKTRLNRPSRLWARWLIVPKAQ